MLLTAYVVAITVAWIVVSIYLIWGARQISYLANQETTNPPSFPSVAIVIAVRNEEDEIETALSTVAAINYPNYHVFVINDRSTDGTPAKLEAIAAINKHIKIITIKELPEGWLGKNHALYQGYLASNHEWLLFTDADVSYHVDTLSKAMMFIEEKAVDHLTVLPAITSRSRLFRSVVTTFSLMLFMKLMPWLAPHKRFKASIGIGAFNLVRRKAYEAAGTHKAFSLRPDDDLKLGEHIKSAGFNQQVAYGKGMIRLEWYVSLRQFIAGLMKNTFSISNYNLFLAFAYAIAVLVVMILPVPLFLLSGYPFYIAALLILFSQAMVMVLARGIDARWWQAFIVPFAGAIMMYIIVVSAVRNLWQGGIYWRGTFYPLKELRKQA